MKKDSEIDFEDIAETDSSFWKDAKIVRRTSKKPITIRLDVDVIDYFKRHSQHYQTEINNILKTYVEAHS